MNSSTAASYGTPSTTTVPIDHLRVGVECRFPLKDENGVLLLGAGTRITTEVISGLRDRGIEELAIHAEDAASMRQDAGASKKAKPAPRRPTASAPRGQHPMEWRAGVPLKASLVDRHHEPLHPERTQHLHERLADARDQFEKLRMDVATKKMQTIEAMSELSSAFAMAIVDDHDQTIGELIRPTSQHNLTERSVKLSVLGMAVGTEMELDGPSILEVGITGLLHDIGLYTTDSELSSPGRQPFNDEQLWEYRKHPVISANCLREVSDIPPSILLAIEQVHEQYDGSGYPFGLEGQRVHVYARILNVCDTYLQLTIGTSFRKPLAPHDALGLILHQARYGMFDARAIHALLRTESLFPLGSRVELTNGQVADVIRRPLQGYARPVLQDLDGERIDMNSESVEVARPVANHGCEQIRLSVDEMQALRWNPADELLLNHTEPAVSSAIAAS